MATGVALVFGYTGLVLLGGYILRMDKYLEVNSVYLGHSGHVSVFKRGGLDRYRAEPKKFSLSEEDQKKIQAVLDQDPRVEFTGKYLKGTGLVSNGCRNTPFLGTGIEPETEKRIRSHPEVVSRLPELVRLKRGEGIWTRPGSASITDVLGQLIDKPKVLPETYEQAPSQDPVDCNAKAFADKNAESAFIQLVANTWSGDFNAVDAGVTSHHVTGIALTEDTDLVGDLSLLQRLYGTSSVTNMAVYLKEPSWIHSYLKDLEGRFQAAGLDLELFSFDDEKVSPFYVGAMNFLYVMASFFLVLVCGVVVLSVVNTLSMTVIERMAELGTLRAVGFTRERISWLLAKEVSLLATASVLIAIPVTFGIAQIVNLSGIRFTVPGLTGDLQFMLLPSWGLGLIVGSILILIAVLSAYLVSLRLLRKKVVELLYGLAG